MPTYVTDEKGNRKRVWSDEEARMFFYRRGYEDAGGKYDEKNKGFEKATESKTQSKTPNDDKRKYTDEDLKAAFTKADELVGAAARAGFEEGHNKGKMAGSDEAYAKMKDQFRAVEYAAESKGYNSGYERGTTDGFRSGIIEGEKEGYKKGYAKGHDEGYGAAIKNVPIQNRINLSKSTFFPKPNLRTFPLRRAFGFIAVPLAIGIFANRYITMRNTEQNNHQKNKPGL